MADNTTTRGWQRSRAHRNEYSHSSPNPNEAPEVEEPSIQVPAGMDQVVRFDQFVLQPDQNLWHQFYHRMNGDRGSEGAWENLGGPFEGAAAVSPFPGRVDLFATGTDGRMWHRVLTEAVA